MNGLIPSTFPKARSPHVLSQFSHLTKIETTRSVFPLLVWPYFPVASVFRTRGEGRCGCEVGVLQFAKQRLTAHEQLQDPAVEGD